MCITLHALSKGLVRREGVMHIVWRKIKKRSVLYSNVVDMDRIPHVFTISEVVQKTLYDNYGVESTVVCNGIVTSCFVSRPKTMPKGQLRVVMVSRLEHDKKGRICSSVQRQRCKELLRWTLSVSAPAWNI